MIIYTMTLTIMALSITVMNTMAFRLIRLNVIIFSVTSHIIMLTVVMPSVVYGECRDGSKRAIIRQK